MDRVFTKENLYDEKAYQEQKQHMLDVRDNERVPRAAERRTGYDEAPYLRGLVRWGKMRNNKYKAAMRAELDARGLAYSDSDGIVGLNTILKTHLRNKWIEENPGVSAEEVYDKDDELSKMFKPVTDRSNFPGREELVQGRC